MDDFSYVRANWGDAYKLTKLTAGDRQYQAIARFGNQDVLLADTANDLLDKIRKHYPGFIHVNPASGKSRSVISWRNHQR